MAAKRVGAAVLFWVSAGAKHSTHGAGTQDFEELHLPGDVAVALQISPRGDPLAAAAEASEERRPPRRARAKHHWSPPTAAAADTVPSYLDGLAAAPSYLGGLASALLQRPRSEMTFEAQNQAVRLPDALNEPSCANAKRVLTDMLDEEHRGKICMAGCCLFTSVIAFAGLFFYAGTRKKPRPPSYWWHGPWLPFSDDFFEEVDVTDLYKGQVQRLLDLTTRADYMGRGRDGAWATHRGFEVLKVTRIENGRRWTDYASRRKLMTNTAETLRQMTPEWRKHSQAVLDTVEDVFKQRDEDPKVREFFDSLGLDKSRNERLMFHGSPGLGALNGQGQMQYDREDHTPCYAIKRVGFDERLGSVKGMYGSGSYFADMASKADQYGGQYNPPGSPQGSVGEVATMFLARVCLGVPYATNQSLEQLRRPPCCQGHFDLNLFFNSEVAIGKQWRDKGVQFDICDHHRFDAVMGDLMIEGKQKLYREYVIYDRRAYPEFCVTYRRVPARN